MIMHLLSSDTIMVVVVDRVFVKIRLTVSKHASVTSSL